MEQFIANLSNGMADGVWFVQYILLFAIIILGIILVAVIVTGIIGAVKRK